MKFKEVKELTINFANKWLYQWLVKKVFGSAIGGLKGWIVSLVFNYAWKKALKPMIQWAWRKGQVIWHRKRNEAKLEELQNAKTESEFDSASDNIP